MKKYLFTIIISLSTLLSCENEMPYNLHEKNPKLIMNAIINADSLTNLLYLNYTGKTEVADVEDADVEITVNGRLKEKAQPLQNTSPTDKQKVFLITSRFVPGDVVRIDARTANGDYHAWIEETVPQRIEVQGIDTATVNENHEYQAHRIRIKAHIKDRPGEKNYYRIVIENLEVIKGITHEGNDTVTSKKNNNYWPWEDFVLTDGKPATDEELKTEIIDRVQNIYGIFDDTWFTDSEYTMTVQTEIYQSYYTSAFKVQTLNIYTNVRLISITEAEYYYLKVLNYYDSSAFDEYLSDPVKIPGNVNGGVGFVGFSTETGKTFHIIKDKDISYYDDEDEQ